MPASIVMPKLGLTMASGTIARWIKRPGDTVREGEPLVEVSTDKITYEVEAPASGTMAQALGNDGDEFACGDVIGTIALPGESDAPATVLEAPRISAAGNGSRQPVPLPEPSVIAPAAASNGGRTIASPAARRLARERGVTLGEVHGTGPRGRITLSDVDAHSPAPALAGVSKGTFPPRLAASRRAIYRKMTEVGLLPLAQVETVARVDAVKALIERRGDFGWTAFAVYAVARMLRDHPDLRTDAMTGAPFAQLDIGVAADTPHGLIVPVVRDAGTRSLAEIQREIVRLAAAARDAALTAHDVGGACFSISNVGPQGVERVAPLPDPPQTAILGIGAATRRPAVVDGTVTAAWMLTCVVSFDHRFIDGAPAARFLSALSDAFTNPGVFL
jgi:pyruvate dehydrogenase E2 component (dihydrolipoamide acetyltransferase)